MQCQVAQLIDIRIGDFRRAFRVLVVDFDGDDSVFARRDVGIAREFFARIICWLLTAQPPEDADQASKARHRQIWQWRQLSRLEA